MSDERTDWVTVKTHKPVRDEARDLDGYTYTDIMQAGIDAIEGKSAQAVAEQSDFESAGLEVDLEGTLSEALAATKADVPDADALAREVVSQMDYAALADSVAEEVVRRLQG